MHSAKRTKLAIQVIFLICGLGLGSWAPLIPYAKDRLQLNDADLGLLLLFLGGGAITTMPLTGWFVPKFGTRTAIIFSAVLIAACLPVLTFTTTYISMALVLFIFGAAIGIIDVAMNTQAILVQQMLGRQVMSSLHGLFSVGGLCGPVVIAGLIKVGLTPLMAAGLMALLLLAAIITQYRFLLSVKAEKEMSPRHTESAGNKSRNNYWFKGPVLYLGALCFAMFLAEGAMLDWSAVFLRDNKRVDEAFTGAGYAAFSLAMAIMRLFGDGIVTRLSSRLVVMYGSVITFAGFSIAILSPWLGITLTGFALVGIGAANIVPIFFSDAGNIKNVRGSAALTVATALGYTGQLAGPALLGFIAHKVTLPVALGVNAALVLAAGISYYVHKTKAMPESAF